MAGSLLSRKLRDAYYEDYFNLHGTYPSLHDLLRDVYLRHYGEYPPIAWIPQFIRRYHLTEETIVMPYKGYVRYLDEEYVSLLSMDQLEKELLWFRDKIKRAHKPHNRAQFQEIYTYLQEHLQHRLKVRRLADEAHEFVAYTLKTNYTAHELEQLLATVYDIYDDEPTFLSTISAFLDQEIERKVREETHDRCT